MENVNSRSIISSRNPPEADAEMQREKDGMGEEGDFRGRLLYHAMKRDAYSCPLFSYIRAKSETSESDTLSGPYSESSFPRSTGGTVGRTK